LAAGVSIQEEEELKTIAFKETLSANEHIRTTDGRGD
jgi:hypothetical protein